MAACVAHAQTANFDVASVKLSPPPVSGARVVWRGGPGSPEPSRWICQWYPIDALLVRAFDVRRYEINGPDWLGSLRVDATATMPPDTNRGQFAEMLRNLLKERLAVATHWEEREVAGYRLVVGKNGAKFQRSASDHSADPPPGPLNRVTLAKDGFPAMEPSRIGSIVVHNRARAQWPGSAMPDLAVNLAEQIGKPVADATGLDGKYDISLHWVTEAGMVEPEPVGPSIFGAVQEQLGLKLEPTKVKLKILVIDHIAKSPLEN